MNLSQNMSNATSTPVNGQSQEVVSESYEGSLIPFQANDAFVNATEMCKAFGKLPNEFLRLTSTQAFIAALTEENQMRGNPVFTQRGAETGGTWLHPDLALECARWLNPKFAIWCNKVIRRILSGELEVKPAFNIPTTLSGALLLADELAAKTEQLALDNAKLADQKAIALREIDAMAPRAALADAAISSRDLLKINDVAKLLCGGDSELGEKRLFEFLRRERILRTCIREDGSRLKEHNTPFQRYLDEKYFEVKEFPVNTRNHGVKISLTTFVTQRGLAYIQGLINRGGKAVAK